MARKLAFLSSKRRHMNLLNKDDIIKMQIIYDLDYYQFLEKGREEGLWQ